MAIYHCPGCGERIPYQDKIPDGQYPNVMVCRDCYNPPDLPRPRPAQQYKPLKHASKAPIDATITEVSVDDLIIGR